MRGFSPLRRLMQAFIEEHELTVAEYASSQQVSYTYSRGGNFSHIDHILIPRTLSGNLLCCKIIPPTADNLSPHLPITCTLNTWFCLASTSTSSAHSSSMRTRFILDWRSMDRNSHYSDLLAGYLSALPLHQSPVDLDAGITKAVHRAAKEAGCLRRWRPPKPWWTPAIAKARDCARYWHKLWLSSSQPWASSIFEHYREARRAYRRACRAAARSVPNQEAQLLSCLRKRGQLRRFWSRVERARRGCLRSNSSCTAEEFASHYSSLTEDAVLTAEQRAIVASVWKYAERLFVVALPERRVSAAEADCLILRLSRGKAPGPDGVTVEHFFYGRSSVMLKCLAQLLTICLSGGWVPSIFAKSTVVPLLKRSGLDPNVLENYRPISLTTVASKLLELILLDELQYLCLSHMLFSSVL